MGAYELCKSLELSYVPQITHQNESGREGNAFFF